MIFLLKNGKYHIISQKESQKQIQKFFNKKKDYIKYILIEDSSPKKSDCFSIVDVNHFDPVFIPFHISYTFSYKSINDPCTKENTFSRVLMIDSLYKKYAIHPLLMQLLRFDIVNDKESYGPFSIALLEVIIKTASEEFHWSCDNNKSLEKFLKKIGLTVQTSKILHTGSPQNDMNDLMDVWKSYLTGNSILYSSYSYQYIYFHVNGHWYINQNPPLKYSNRYKYELCNETPWIYCGVYIDGSELVYLMPREETLVFNNVAYLDIYSNCSYTGTIDIYYQESAFNRNIQCNILSSILEACLIFPQICDMDCFVYGIIHSYIKLQIVMKDKSLYGKMFEMPAPKGKLEPFDLFLMILDTMKETNLIN